MALLRGGLALLAALLIGAHFWRAGQHGLQAACWLSPALLLLRRRWALYVFEGVLWGSAALWLWTTFRLVGMRQSLGAPWLRLALILGGVTLLTVVAAWLLRHKSWRLRYPAAPGRTFPPLSSFALSAALLTVVHLKVQPPMLLLERFWPGAGWLQLLLLALYAGWITEKLLDPAQSARWRFRLWAIFSLVFFGQLALGLLLSERFLMSGKLHLPIPALVVGGSLYRGGGLFMPILFGATVLLVGPAWCSYLCYIGAWDASLARLRRKPQPLPRWRNLLRLGLLVVVIGAALGLRWAGVPPLTAGMLALFFGLVGVGLMLFWSRRTGGMTHCVSFCPLGLLATWLGRLSPFRLSIGDDCSSCGLCRRACRYDALNAEDIARRRPASSCTLCGDCLVRCKTKQLSYSFWGLPPAKARTLFLILVASLHTVFLGVARL